MFQAFSYKFGKSLIFATFFENIIIIFIQCKVKD